MDKQSQVSRASGPARSALVERVLRIVSTAGLGATLLASTSAATDCAGCVGTSGSSTVSSGGYSVTIEVDVTNGECVGTSPSCTAEACEVSILRSRVLPPSTSMSFCILRPPQPPLCIFPPPDSGPTGSGNETWLDLIRCGAYKTYTIAGGGLSAQATGSCSSCM